MGRSNAAFCCMDGGAAKGKRIAIGDPRGSGPLVVKGLLSACAAGTTRARGLMQKFAGAEISCCVILKVAKDHYETSLPSLRSVAS
jgi:hypothetical protein